MTLQGQVDDLTTAEFFSLAPFGEYDTVEFQVDGQY
ncbi:hypothetical protein SAMN04488561_1655 [Jiangella alba]|uniref:Uncharacterized protein n=1 Tax=Jiangella alba TaxID=561176 RepID=A0A1H5JQ68_9ACTN|nr:hypothetical protein SAMN04488561_1655 [Jiangella alba]